MERFDQHKLGCYEHDELFEITTVSYYIDDILYSVVISISSDTEV